LVKPKRVLNAAALKDPAEAGVLKLISEMSFKVV